MFHVKVRVVERQQEKLFAIDDHVLAVIANQIVRRAGYRNAFVEQAHFERAQFAFPAPVFVGDAGVNGDAAFDGANESRFDFLAIEAENGDLNVTLGVIDGVDQGLDAISGLNE
jgi:hypothetical protein